jgi:hypothetical protein
MMANENLPERPSATTGLERFAAAWVERWLALGGSIAVGGDGKASLFALASASDVPGYEPPPADWPDFIRQDRVLFDNHMLCGRQRELMDLLDAVIGGREAVKEHVRQFPSHAYSDGRRDVA